MVTATYVNLPITDIPRSRAFFEALGFAFNPQFSNDDALGLELAPGHNAMLLKREFFATFTKKRIVDAHKDVECLVALQLDSRAAVDALMQKGLAAGGTEPRETQDLGFMYSRALADLDGHVWEPFFMDMSQMPETPQ